MAIVEAGDREKVCVVSTYTVQESIGKFIAARQLSNHPITVSSWDRDVNMRNQGVGFDER